MATKTALLLFTFNCAKEKQPVGVIKDALEGALAKVAKPALVVVGLEEVDSIMHGCFEDTQSRVDPIEQGISEALGDEYTQRSKTIVGAVVLLTYAVRTLQVKALTARVRCGMYLSGLKGGAAARLIVDDDEEFTFVNAHLAANEGYAQTRNRDFHRIATCLDFGDGYGLYKPGAHTFFMGDLNYRATKMYGLLAGDELSDRLQKDELLHELRDQHVLYGFEEAPITFAPTYKYVLGTNEYKANRTPSWCDRILYLGYGGAQDVSVYNAITSVMTSDHKPVYLGISVPVGGPSNVFEREGLLKRTLGHEVSLKLDATYPYYDMIGSKVDSIIGWAIYAGTSVEGRAALAAVFVFVLVLFYYL